MKCFFDQFDTIKWIYLRVMIDSNKIGILLISVIKVYVAEPPKAVIEENNVSMVQSRIMKFILPWYRWLRNWKKMAQSKVELAGLFYLMGGWLPFATMFNLWLTRVRKTSPWHEFVGSQWNVGNINVILGGESKYRGARIQFKQILTRGA